MPGLIARAIPLRAEKMYNSCMVGNKYLIAAVVSGLCVLGFAYAQSTESVQKKFSHVNHFGKQGLGKIKDCTDCHRYDPQTRLFTRPDHEFCQTCHATEFQAKSPTKEFCKNCHAATFGAELKPLPDHKEGFIALKSFSHDKHLNTDGAVFSKFGRMLCDTCHDVDRPDGTAGMPGHAQCSLCHGESADKTVIKPLLSGQARMSDCITCHADARTEPTTRPARERSFQEDAFGAGVYAGDLIFSHKTHLTHTGEQSCQSCHKGVASDTEGKALHLPSMFSCAECHDDPERVPSTKAMKECATCHTNIRQGEKPAPGQHYGDDVHYGGSVQTKVQTKTVYCGWCHSKDEKVFPIQKSYIGSVAYYCGKPNKKKKKPKDFVSKPRVCVACHTSEGVDEDPPKLCPQD